MLILAAGAPTASGCQRRSSPPRAAPIAATATPAAKAPTEPVSLPLPETPPDLTTQPRRARGGSLRVHLDAEPPHLHPLQDAHEVIHRVVVGTVYEPLVECRGGRYVPALAETWEIEPERIVLRLRPGVTFHDGRLLSPMDVQATFETILRAGSRVPALGALLSDVEAVEIVPDRSVRLRLLRPAPSVLRALCEIPILPGPSLRAGAAGNAHLARQPQGTGPFRFLAWDRSRRIRLGAHRTGWRGAPPADEIVFEIEPDPAQALIKARRGEIDVVPRLHPVHYPAQVVPAALGESLRLRSIASQRVSFIVLNVRREILGDVRVRRALDLLWDRNRGAQDSHGGLALPVAAPPFLDPDAAAPPFDPAAAERLLDEGGYRDANGDGVRDVRGAPIRLTLLSHVGSRAMAIEGKQFAHELRRRGLLLDLVTADAATFDRRLQAGDFDLAPLVWEGRPDDDLRPVFSQGGAFNHGGFASPVMEHAFDRWRMAPDARSRAAVGPLIASVLRAEIPVLFLYHHRRFTLVGARVEGLSQSGGELDLRWALREP